MENLHFKIRSTWIESMLSRIMESDLLDNPSNLMLISGLAWLSCPESLISFFARIINQFNCINLINWLIKWNLGRSVIRNECKHTLLPVIVCLNGAIVYEGDVHWRCSCIVDITIWEVPVCSILIIIPFILLFLVFNLNWLIFVYLY